MDARAPRLRTFAAAAFLWGAAEAFLFFVVPDVLLAWVALRRGLKAALICSLLAAAGATLGGAAMYGWAARSPETAARAVEAVPAVQDGSTDRAVEAMRREGWFRAAATGAFAGRPYKLYSAAAPRAGVKPAAWVAGAAPIRLPRFLMMSVGFAALGALLRERMDRRMMLAVYGTGWALFYAAFWTVTPG
ncbi:hypothetical protein [Caulobacter sp. 17J80-11]|uniref:hypothetical protein n=1 Tax=Caulobacter sp. 17J80-11 TaxID=2763502 RepID=UPI001653DF06|nr:hypothetical protein [Caulobacter sp. 17J80-11]MBC6982775.1 hypothetical protein [Caulobacter sp. 17J80-11]